MKVIGSDVVVNIVNKPLNVLDEIRKKTITDVQEEPLYICDLTDIIEKHRTWTQMLPRIKPFYGMFYFSFLVILLSHYKYSKKKDFIIFI